MLGAVLLVALRFSAFAAQTQDFQPLFRGNPALKEVPVSFVEIGQDDEDDKSSAGEMNDPPPTPPQTDEVPTGNTGDPPEDGAPPSDKAEQKQLAEAEADKEVQSPGATEDTGSQEPSSGAPSMATPDVTSAQDKEDKQAKSDKADQQMMDGAVNGEEPTPSLSNVAIVDSAAEAEANISPSPAPAPSAIVPVNATGLSPRCHVVKVIVCDNDTDTSASPSPSPSVSPSPVPMVFPDNWEGADWSKTGFSPTPSPSPNTVPGALDHEVTDEDRLTVMNLIDQKRKHVIRMRNRFELPSFDGGDLGLNFPKTTPASLSAEALRDMAARLTAHDPPVGPAEGARNGTEGNATHTVPQQSPPPPRLASQLVQAPIKGQPVAPGRHAAPMVFRGSAVDDAFMMDPEVRPRKPTTHAASPSSRTKDREMSIGIPAGERLHDEMFIALPAVDAPRPAIALPPDTPTAPQARDNALLGLTAHAALSNIDKGFFGDDGPSPVLPHRVGAAGLRRDGGVIDDRKGGLRQVADTAPAHTLPRVLKDTAQRIEAVVAPRGQEAATARAPASSGSRVHRKRMDTRAKADAPQSLAGFAEVLAKPNAVEQRIIKQFEEMATHSNPRMPLFLANGPDGMDPSLKAMLDQQAGELYAFFHAKSAEINTPPPPEEMNHDTVASTIFGWAENGPKPWELPAPRLEDMRAGITDTLYDMFHSDRMGNMAPRPVAPPFVRGGGLGTRPYIDQTVESGGGLTVREDGTERIVFQDPNGRESGLFTPAEQAEGGATGGVVREERAGELRRADQTPGGAPSSPGPSSQQRTPATPFTPTEDGNQEEEGQEEENAEVGGGQGPRNDADETKPVIPKDDFPRNAPPPVDSLMIPPSRSPSPSPTISVSPAVVPSHPPTASATVSFTPSWSVSPTPSLTRGASPSTTPSATTSASVTATLAASPSFSPASSPSPSPASSLSPSPAASPILSTSPSSTPPPSQSTAASPSVTPSRSPAPSLEEECCPSSDLPDNPEIEDMGFWRGYDVGFESGLHRAWEDIQKGALDLDVEGEKPAEEETSAWMRSSPFDEDIPGGTGPQRRRRR